ncbi:MAG: DNA/RNA non-specific endonuclease [Bacteroidota bacterium]
MKKLLLFLFLISFVACLEEETPATPSSEKDPEAHLLLGNPSNANNDPDNYLLKKDEFVVSYNRSRGTANWVSWHLSQAWNGNAERRDDFRQDPDLPEDWFRAGANDYRGSGFDRGHLCPSADRDATQAENSATFVMTNIIPQAPENNREVWRELEEYCRARMNQGNELYIIAGVYGHGGTGNNGGRTLYLADRNIFVPAQTWKVVLILPEGTDDLSRINANTEVIAVDMPNAQSVRDTDWEDYRVSVDAIEAATGYDFFDLLPDVVEQELER